MDKITIRSDRKEDYIFQYKGEDVTLKAGSIISIADGLAEVVLPTCVMKVVKNLIVIIFFIYIFEIQASKLTFICINE